MTFVEREHPVRALASSQNHDRRIGETDPQVTVPCNYIDGCSRVVSKERHEVVCPVGDLAQEAKRSVSARFARKQVVDLGKDERREYERRAGRFKRRSRGLMHALVADKRRQQTTRVQKNHPRPKPSARSASTRSARSGSPTASNNGSVGRGR